MTARQMTNTGPNAPSQAILERTGATANPVKLTGRRPAYSGIRNIVITTRPIAQDGSGPVITEGEARVTVTLEDGETLTNGDCLRAHKNSHAARPGSAGPLEIKQLFDEDDEAASTITNSSGADMTITALVLLRHVRADYLYIKDNAGAVYGPFDHIIFNEGLSLSETSKGHWHANDDT